MYLTYLPCQGENKPILMKIGNQSKRVLFPRVGWTLWWMLQVYDFLGRGREGWFSAPLSFVPLENPDFPNARKKGRRARPAGLQGGGEEKRDPSLSLSGVEMRWLIGKMEKMEKGKMKKAERPLSQCWSTNEVANCHRKPLSLFSFSLCK